jgi:hypothetical protein
MATEMRRALSPVERWYWIADQVSPLNVIARTRLCGRLPADVLERAVAALAAEYPALRVAIAADPDGTNPVFTPSAPAPSVRRVNGGDAEWERQVGDHELTTSLDWRRGPLVRVVDVVVDGRQEVHDLVLTASHIIADGTTALTLLRRLVEDAGYRPGADEVVSRPVVAAPEDLLPARHRGPRGVARIAATGLADRVGTAWARPRRLTPESAVPAARRRTRLIRRAIDSAQVDTLTRRCHAEGVTVHGALAAAMAMVVGPAAAGCTAGRVCIGSPIDFRAELDPPVPAEEAGAYVSTVPSTARFGDGRDVWSIAQDINRTLDRRRRSGQHLALLSALRFVCPGSVATSARVIGLIERNGPGNICISNIGRYDFPDRIGDWRLSGAQFIAGVSVSGYFAATVNTSHGQLFWNFTYIDGVVSETSARRYADGSVRTLLDAIDAASR